MEGKGRTPRILKKIVRWVERAIIISLIGVMSLLLLLATVELVHNVYTALIDTSADKFVINLDNLLNVFGVFLLVLIGIELLDTIKVYFRENVIHVEVVMLVALIAVARKVIVLDFEEHTSLEILSIAAVIIAISSGYFLIKKTGTTGFIPKEKEEKEDIVVEEKPVSADSDQMKKKKTIKRKVVETPTEETSEESTDTPKDTTSGKDTDNSDEGEEDEENKKEA